MEYDKSKYKIRRWKNPMFLHWIINPALAFNELILGQRVPKIVLIERDNNKSLAEKTFVPCPHCDTLHPGLKWSTQNNTAFQNWFGLYCDKCGNIIPCLFNLSSLIILGLSFPIWIWFVAPWKKRWLEKQAGRYENLDLSTIPDSYSGRAWIRTGLFWGFFMFVFMVFALPYASGEEISLQGIGAGIIIWTIAGLGFGLLMKAITGKRKIRPQEE